MNLNVFVGTCGFPIGRSKYYKIFSTVELQDTFYNPPDPEKLKRMRQEAPSDFKFNMKAWQAITHPPSSPTWRRAKVKIPKDKSDVYGYLRPTKENFEAWERIKEGAKALNAQVVVIQLPASFRCNSENLKNAIEFLSSVTPSGFKIGIEVRGEWRERPEFVSRIVEVSDEVIHVVDPFRWQPVLIRDVTYFRLHGIGKGDVNYKYKYTTEDLQKLKEIVAGLKNKTQDVYVLFNNVYMLGDAQEFIRVLSESP